MSKNLIEKADHLARMTCKLLRPSLNGEGPSAARVDLRRLNESAHAWLEERHNMTKEQEQQLLDDPAPAQSYAPLSIALGALKAAYAYGHHCDLGERCPGCMAGNALEQITERKWAQEECEDAEDKSSLLSIATELVKRWDEGAFYEQGHGDLIDRTRAAIAKATGAR